MSMDITQRSPTIAEYHRLRRLVGWPDTDETAARSGLENSLFCVVATDDGRAVGCGRIVGDGGLYYYIQDLMVLPEYQSKGIGKAMMEMLMTYIASNARPGSMVALMAAVGLEPYYRSFGFVPRAADAPGMYQVIQG